MKVGVRDTGVNIAGRLYLRLDVAIATAYITNPDYRSGCRSYTGRQ